MVIISDLNYLEEVKVEETSIEGGIANFFSKQSNVAIINQRATAIAGNGLVGIGNLATAVNAAVIIQANS